MNQLITIEPEKYWFSFLPSGWNIGRIKDLYNQVSNTGSNLDEGAYIPLENLESFTGKLIQRVNNENNETTNLFRKGDILLNKLRPYLAKVHLAEFNGCVSGEVVVLRNLTIWKRNTSNRYFFYRFLSSAFINKINSMSEGVKMPRINPSKILALEIAIPSIEQQTEISKYLDTKTQAIDKKVSLLEKKIGYYQELRKSLINETVTKGLEKNVKLKDSGIDWIGQIPEHWEMKRVKDVFFSLAGGTPSTKNQEYWNGTIPWIPSGKVQNNDVLIESVDEYISDLALQESSTKIAKKDSVLIALTGATCSNIGYLTFDTTINQSIVALYPLPKTQTVPRFYFYFLIAAKEKIKTYMTGGAQGGINQEDVRFLEIVNPPKKEQYKIVKFLETKIGLIDKIITNIQTQITTLKELRKTLINDVVTGKIKVIQD